MSQIQQRLSYIIVIALFAFGLIGILAACSSPTEAVPNTPEPTAQPTLSEGVLTVRPPVGLEPTATIPPPPYREPSTSITLETVADIEYLGRLDVLGRKSTLFDWVISSDGIQLAALNNDLLLEWNLVTGTLNFNTSRGNINKVLYSLDRNEVYGIDVAGQTVVHQSITGDRLTTIDLHPEYSGVVTYDDTRGHLAVAGDDGTIKVWDMLARESLVTYDAHADTIVNMAFSSDGQALATTGVDGTIKIWAWETKTQVAEYDLQNAVAQAMVFSSDDSQLAVATQNFVAMWNVFSGELDYVLQSGTATANEVLAFSPDGRFLLTAGSEGNMRLWNTETSDLEIELPDIGGNRVSAVFSVDSSLLVTTILGKDASLWNLTDITERTVGRAPLSVPSNNLFGVDMSSDGYSLLFFDATGDIYVWGIPQSSN